MLVPKRFVALTLAGWAVFGFDAAYAHCDSIDGPVAKAVEKALDTGNVYPVLAYAPATAEPEIIAAFQQSRKVRTLGPDARALADRSFLETAIRLHHVGEGAPFTGVKPAGTDYGPAIPVAEDAVESGDASKDAAQRHRPTWDRRTARTHPCDAQD